MSDGLRDSGAGAGDGLVVRDLRFGYSRRHEVLHGVSAQMPAGALTAVVGPNGCGKTTLLTCLNRINSPWSGEVRLGGRSLLGCPLPQLARLMGYVPQRASVGLSCTVVDYLLLGRRQFLSWSPTADDLDAVARVMARLGIEELADAAMTDLSGGQRQKVVVARALLQEPRALLFDEPTSNLDIRNQREILDLAASLAHDEGKVVVAVLHDLSAALRYADRAVLMRGGSVVNAGRPDEVLTARAIEDVYGAPVRIGDDGYVNPFA